MGARHGSRYGWRHLARHLPRHPNLRRIRRNGIPAQVIRWCAKRIHQAVDGQGKGSLHRQAIPKQLNNKEPKGSLFLCANIVRVRMVYLQTYKFFSLFV